MAVGNRLQNHQHRGNIASGYSYHGPFTATIIASLDRQRRNCRGQLRWYSRPTGLLVCPPPPHVQQVCGDSMELDGEEVRAVEEAKDNREIRGSVKEEKAIRSLSEGWST